MHFYKEIGANKNVLDVKENGYKIPFISTPKPAEFKNNKSALLNDSFVSDSIQELLRTKRIVEIPFKPHVVSPLSVSTNKGKTRLILDLRYVNLHVWKERVKFEDWKVFLNYLSKEGSIFSFDLKSGYHHVDICPPHETFLGFLWVVDGVQKYFCFTVFPFGLSSSPYIFIKLLRPFVRFWRFNGVMTAVCIDDGIGISSDYETALMQTALNLSERHY